MSSVLPRITNAELDWRGDLPVSRRYADVYYASDDGLGETRHVFIDGNRLMERWAGDRCSFVIAETGFGSGLNFLATALEWLKHGEPSACLHFYSVERYPFTAEDTRRALSRWPELEPVLSRWLAVYPPAVHGFHHRELFDGRVRLTLAYMDVFEWIRETDLCADAWYLDGFAPARNAELWAPAVLDTVAAHTRPGGTFATFTVAAAVRKHLGQHFDIEKRPGFAGKREMARGTRRTATGAAEGGSAAARPWFGRPAGVSSDAGAAGERRAVVVGAGLAGAWTACALAGRGWHVTVVERHDRPAAEASGNALGVIYGRFSAFDGAEARFHQQAYLYAVRRFQMRLTGPGLWRACGMLQTTVDPAEQRRQRALIEAGLWSADWLEPLTAGGAGDKAGLPPGRPGLFFPCSGWLAPARVCRHLLQGRAGIRWMPGRAVEALDYNASRRCWRLLGEAGRVIEQAPVVVLANAGEASRFEPAAFLPLKQIRGQITEVRATSQSSRLNTVLCYDGYLTPAVDGRHSLGATFDLHSGDRHCRASDDRRNLERLAAAAPEVYAALCGGGPGEQTGPDILGARTGFRCHTPDYLPAVGPVPDLDFYRTAYTALAGGQFKRRYPTARMLPGLYVNVAHGSRGITSTPLCAEVLAAYINGEPQPVPESLRAALHPARFPVRDLKRGRPV